MSTQYIAKNVAFVVGVLQTSIKSRERIELSHIALMLPLLLDDTVVEAINDNRIKYSFESLISAKRMPLANYNDRYLSTLPLLYQAIALLLDIEAVSMRDGMLVAKKKSLLDPMITTCSSECLSNMCKATIRLFEMTEGKNIAQLYKLLNVEL